MSKLMYTAEEATEATLEQLAQSVLECADGSPIGNSLAMTAAKELARRIVPSVPLVDSVGQMPIGNISKGQAEPSALSKRMTQQTIDSLSIGRS